MSGTEILNYLDYIGFGFWNYLAWQQVIWLQTALWQPVNPDGPDDGSREMVEAAIGGLHTRLFMPQQNCGFVVFKL